MKWLCVKVHERCRLLKKLWPDLTNSFIYIFENRVIFWGIVNITRILFCFRTAGTMKIACASALLIIYPCSAKNYLTSVGLSVWLLGREGQSQGLPWKSVVHLTTWLDWHMIGQCKRPHSAQQSVGMLFKVVYKINWLKSHCIWT